MSIAPSLPPEITIREEATDRVRYILPLRNLKYGKWIGGILLIVGLLISLCTAWTLYLIGSTVLNLPVPRKGSLGGFAFFFAVFGAPMTWGGFAPFWWGLVSFHGHREIEIQGDYLLTVERCGPFWRSKRWKVDQIGSFEVKPLANYSKGESPPPIDLAAEFNALIIHPRNGKQGMVAWGYPVSMLVAVAQTLASRCNQAAEVKGFAEANKVEHSAIYVYGAGVTELKKPNVSINDTLSDEDPDEEDLDDDEDWDEEIDPDAPVTAPAGTTIRIDRMEEKEFTITIPPAGVWKGSKGLFFFSLLWCGVLTFMTIVIVIAMQKPGQAKDDSPWVAPVVFGLFWVVGIGMFLGALNMGRRRAAIALVNTQLMAIQTGIFGSKKREWQLNEIKEVRVGPSGIEVNSQPVNELQILDQKDDKFGFLSERDDEELRWLAWEIRQSLPKSSHPDEAT